MSGWRGTSWMAARSRSMNWEIDGGGDVQHARACRQRLGLSAGGVAGGRAGGGDADAEAAGDARIGVRHVHRPGLAARRHEADAALAGDGVQNRHVVDGYDAEHGGDADLRQDSGRPVRQPFHDPVRPKPTYPARWFFKMNRDTPPETSSCAPVM